jgi:hypothetical protein
MGYTHGKAWSSWEIMEALRPFINKYGRMPTATELRARGRNDLACAVGRSGGFRYWAKKCKAVLKVCETVQGQRVEAEVAEWLRDQDFEVRRMTTKAPYDLRVNRLRVDVKSGHWTESSSGWVFHLGKKDPPRCDVYVVVCLDDLDRHMRRYVIPADRARVQTMTITDHGKYEHYRDAIEHLRG